MPVPRPSTTGNTELDAALAKCESAGEGDSNDKEIEALQDALDLAVRLVTASAVQR